MDKTVLTLENYVGIVVVFLVSIGVSRVCLCQHVHDSQDEKLRLQLKPYRQRIFEK